MRPYGVLGNLFFYAIGMIAHSEGGLHISKEEKNTKNPEFLGWIHKSVEGIEPLTSATATTCRLISGLFSGHADTL